MKKSWLILLAIGGAVAAFLMLRRPTASPSRSKIPATATTGSVTAPESGIYNGLLDVTRNALARQSNSMGKTSLAGQILPGVAMALTNFLAPKAWGAVTASPKAAPVPATVDNYYYSTQADYNAVTEGGNDPRLFNPPQTVDLSGQSDPEAVAAALADESAPY